jgi:hypothetical protein
MFAILKVLAKRALRVPQKCGGTHKIFSSFVMKI